MKADNIGPAIAACLMACLLTVGIVSCIKSTARIREYNARQPKAGQKVVIDGKTVTIVSRGWTTVKCRDENNNIILYAETELLDKKPIDPNSAGMAVTP